MDACAVHSSLWEILEQLNENLKSKRLEDVFRFISFYPSETYCPHKHLRIEINYVKKGYCILHLDNESVTFKEGEIMVITSDVNQLFAAGIRHRSSGMEIGAFSPFGGVKKHRQRHSLR